MIALLRLLETTTWRGFLLAVALVGAIALALWLAQPLLIAMGHGSLILFFVVLVAACVLIGVPIAFTFGIATFSYLALTTDLPLVIVVNRIDDGISNLLLLAVPMFVVLGLLMEMTGIARVMVNFLAALIGHDFYHAGEVNHVRSLLAGEDRWLWVQQLEATDGSA